MEADALALLLARIQFAFTVSFHFIFPSFSIGLASFLAVLEFRWLKTGQPKFLDLYKYWLKIFAIVFAMGVVSGIVLSYQFGTNWSVFSDKAGPIIGPSPGPTLASAVVAPVSAVMKSSPVAASPPVKTTIEARNRKRKRPTEPGTSAGSGLPL